MHPHRRVETSATPGGRAIGVSLATVWLILLACPAHAAAFSPMGESAQHFRGEDYGGATTSDTDRSRRGYPYQSVVASHAMYRNKELTREISTLDSRWGATTTYSVPSGARRLSLTFRWDINEAEAIVRGGSPVTTDTGGPNSTELKLVATSPGCKGCVVSTGVTSVARADSVSPYMRVGNRSWLWGPVRITKLVSFSVSKTAGTLPSTLEVQSFFTMASRLGGVGSLLLLVDADLWSYEASWSSDNGY